MNARWRASVPGAWRRRTVRVCVGVVTFVAAFFLLASRSARAAGTTSALSWVRLAGAEGCIPVGELSTRVERRLGRAALVSPSVADVAIEGHVERKVSPRGFHAVLRGTRRDGSEIGVRELDAKGDDCRRMDDDLVLVMALLIDPDAVGAPRPPPPPVDPHDPTPEPSSRSIDTDVGARLAFGLFPDVAAGLTVGARLGLGRYALGVALFSTLATETDAPGPVSYGVTDGELSFGRRWSVTRHFEVAGDVGARFGVMTVAGAAEPGGKSASLALADLAIGPRLLEILAGPLYSELSGSLVVPLLRQETQQQTGTSTPSRVWERPPVGGELILSMGCALLHNLRLVAPWIRGVAMLSSILLAMPAAPPRPVAFADVYAEHGAFVWRSLRRLGVREADIEDVCQETFVVAHRKLGDFTDGSMRAWLFAIALRVASDYRKRAHIRTEVALDPAMEPWAAAPQPAQIDRARAKQWLEAILASLEEDKRAVFVGYELEEMPMKELAAALGCPLQTAYSRLHAARAHVTSAITRLQKRERSDA